MLFITYRLAFLYISYDANLNLSEIHFKILIKAY